MRKGLSLLMGYEPDALFKRLFAVASRAGLRPCHLRPTCKESVEACVVALVGCAEEAQSGACSALSVGRSESQTRSSDPGNAISELSPIFAGEIPARES